MLEAYGFSELDPKKSDTMPHPCFEKVVRHYVKKGYIDENNELEGDSIEELAKRIRENEVWTYEEKYQKTLDTKYKDNNKKLVHDSLSYPGCDIGSCEEYYWSFCRDYFVQGSCTWHCRTCGKC